MVNILKLFQPVSITKRGSMYLILKRLQHIKGLSFKEECQFASLAIFGFKAGEKGKPPMLMASVMIFWQDNIVILHF